MIVCLVICYTADVHR